MTKDRVSALKMLISPIKDLPNELISWIFEQYAYGSRLVSDGKTLRTPWYLGQICSRWRQVALATPNLWNSFVIRLHGFESPPTNIPSEPLEATRELLRRTENSPISSILSCSNDDLWSVKSGFKLLAHHASRLCCLIIDCEGIFPETLYITSSMLRPPPRNIITPITLFDESPNLRRLYAHFTSDFDGYIDLISLHLRWDQITHLHLSGIGRATHHSIHALLSRCTNLVDCSLSIPRDSSGNGAALDTITLKYLDTLRITDDIWSESGQFLQYLIVPSLRRLTVADNYVVDAVVDLCKRSGCRPKEAKFASCRSDRLMFGLLRNLPSVERFSMDDEAFLLELVQHMGHHSFLPDFWFIECRVRDLKSIVAQLTAPNLPQAAFTQRISDDYPGIRVTLVIDETEDASKLQGLDRDRLKVTFRRSYHRKDFLGYFAEEGDKVWDELPVGYTNYYRADSSYQYW